VIHKITEKSPFQDGQCPFGHNKSNKTDDIDSITDEESYKKLRKVMTQITAFYEGGTNLKKGHYEQMQAEMAKLDVDKKMCEEQIAALNEAESLKQHPRSKGYVAQLEAEMENFGKQRKLFEDKLSEFEELWQWSTVIVKVCKWLELCLDHYANERLKLGLELEALPKLSEDDKTAYGKGLDEITYNLQESQDFFKASVDGRLKRYHEVEKAIIEAQLDVLAKYDPENARTKHWGAELLLDLQGVEHLLEDDETKTARRKRMLSNHAAFLEVLKFNREKLDLPFKVNQGRQYDPKFDFNPAAVIAEHGGY